LAFHFDPVGMPNVFPNMAAPTFVNPAMGRCRHRLVPKRDYAGSDALMLTRLCMHVESGRPIP